MSDSEVLSMFPALEGLKEILAEKDAEWSLRSKTLQQLQTVFSSQGPSLTSREKELLARYIRDIQPSISQHFAERRSALTREGCLAIAAAAEALFTERHFYEEAMPAFLSVLLKQLVITIKVISESAHRAIISMLKACGGSGLNSISSATSTHHYHHHHPLSAGILVLCEGIAASHPQVRSKSAEYLGVILETKNAIHLPHEMVEAIEASLTKALTDAAPEARSNARKAQPTLQKIKTAVGLPSGSSSSVSSSSSTSTFSSSAILVQATNSTIPIASSSSSAPVSAPVVPFSLPSASTSTSASASTVPQTTNTTSVAASIPRSLFGSGPQRILKKMTASSSTTTASSTPKPGSFFSSSSFSSHFTSLAAVQPSSISASAPVPASTPASVPAPAAALVPAPASVPTSAPVIPASSTSTPTVPASSTIPVAYAVRPFSYSTPVVALPPTTTTTTPLASVATSSDSVRDVSSSSASSAENVSSSTATADATSSSGSVGEVSSSSSSAGEASPSCSAEEISSSSSSSGSVGEDLAWAIENIAGIVDELCRGVEHPNKATTLPALADLGKFIYLHGRSLDTITLPPSSSSMANTLAERILPVLLRILAENPPSAQEEERAGAGGESLVSSLSSAAMVALEMVMARLPSCYLLPLFLRVCLKNVKTSPTSTSSPSSSVPNNLALVTAQFCLECIVQLLPFSNPFFGDTSNLIEFRAGLQSLLQMPSVLATVEQEEIKKVALLVLNYLDKMFPITPSTVSVPTAATSEQQSSSTSASSSSSPVPSSEELLSSASVISSEQQSSLSSASSEQPSTSSTSDPVSASAPSSEQRSSACSSTPTPFVPSVEWGETLSKAAGLSVEEVSSAILSALGTWADSQTALRQRVEAKDAIQTYFSSSSITEQCNKALVVSLLKAISDSSSGDSNSSARLQLVLRLVAQRLVEPTVRASLLEELSSVDSTEQLSKNMPLFLQHSSAAVRKATVQLRQSLSS